MYYYTETCNSQCDEYEQIEYKTNDKNKEDDDEDNQSDENDNEGDENYEDDDDDHDEDEDDDDDQEVKQCTRVCMYDGMDRH